MVGIEVIVFWWKLVILENYFFSMIWFLPLEFQFHFAVSHFCCFRFIYVYIYNIYIYIIYIIYIYILYIYYIYILYIYILYIYMYGIHHQRINRNNSRKVTSVRFEPTTTESRSDALTDWAVRPRVQLTLRANFIQLIQFQAPIFL